MPVRHLQNHHHGAHAQAAEIYMGMSNARAVSEQLDIMG
jgi:hypothetical protein